MEKEVTTHDQLAALLHEERLRILGALAVENATLPTLANRTRLATRKVITHLQMLVHFRLATEDRSGPEAVYALNIQTLNELAQSLVPDDRRGPVRPTLPMDILDDEERKIVLGYMKKDGTFKEIPYVPKRQKALVHYISQAFEVGRVYREKEVNEVLERFHPDYATLRRFLVDFLYLERTANGSQYQVAGERV